jgi:hypothetical protein
MTQYRKPTENELADAAREMSYLAEWHGARHFALELYGPKAARVRVEVTSEYDDNNYNYYDALGNVDVLDAEGNELEPDVTLPFWVEREYKPGDEPDFITIEGARDDMLYTPDDDRSYDLTQKPKLDIANRIFIAEEETDATAPTTAG